MLVIAGVVVLAGIGVFGAIYLGVSARRVYIDQAVVSAPQIQLSPVNAGVLLETMVKEGDSVVADQPVARVGNEIVKATVAGTIVSVDDNIGQFMNPLVGQGVVATMIDPTELRIVGHLAENKGLINIQAGNPVVFTVDAFGSKQFRGVVDEVSPTSRSSDVVFSISDQRPTNEFDVKVRYDVLQYPELKNGMSARIWVYTK